MAEPIQAGLQGATPRLVVCPVDAKLPACGKPVDGTTCIRKEGHWGACQG